MEHPDVQPLDGEPVLRQVDAIERAVVALAVLQVIEDLQGGAERVGGGVVGRMLAVQVEQVAADGIGRKAARSEEHTSELQSLMSISYAVSCLKKTTISHVYTVNY